MADKEFVLYMKYTLSIFLLVVLTACQKTENIPVNNGEYFSIVDYAYDQWKMNKDQPYGIEKISYVNGKTDTTYTNVENVDWGVVFRIFNETDISNPKFLDRYNFSEFPDTATNTMNYYYEANDPKLFTRKLHIMTHPATGRITSVYIETLKNNSWGSRTQRLFYIPVKSIVIQEFEATATGDKKDIRVEYRFL